MTNHLEQITQLLAKHSSRYQSDSPFLYQCACGTFHSDVQAHQAAELAALFDLMHGSLPEIDKLEQRNAENYQRYSDVIAVRNLEIHAQADVIERVRAWYESTKRIPRPVPGIDKLGKIISFDLAKVALK